MRPLLLMWMLAAAPAAWAQDVEPVQDILEPPPSEAPEDVGVDIGRALGRVAITTCTTCSCLSFCTTGGLGCLASSALLFNGTLERRTEYLMVGAAGAAVSIALLAVAGLVIAPVGVVLRQMGLWDPYTERFILEMWTVMLSILV